jgi:hypothetical protein
MRSQKEISDEIERLMALCLENKFKHRLAEIYASACEELKFGFDDTSEEWDELSEDARCAIIQARDWKECRTDNTPTKYWA